MDVQRFGHTASRLGDGTVLIAGGFSDLGGTILAVPGASSGAASTSLATVDLAELYDPSSQTFAPGAAMIQARESHTATELDNGEILITGGDNGRDAFESAELFDPATGLFSQVRAVMSAPRTGHTATKLPVTADPAGRVLIVGGSPAFNPNNGVFVGSLSSAELFDSRSEGGQFSPLSVQTNVARSGHAATLLADGKVLITGGVDQQGLPQDTSELFEILNTSELTSKSKAPLKARFVPTGNMNTARFFHGSILLHDGTVLVVGGVGADNSALASAEIYDPVRRSFTSIAPMNEARQSPALTLLSDGRRVLIAGGSGDIGRGTGDDSVEIYDQDTSPPFTLITSSQSQRRSATATLLGGGTVLIAGGYQASPTSTGGLNLEPAAPEGELFDPVSDSFTPTLSSMVMPRAYQTATLVNSPSALPALAGKVLIVGGKNLNPLGSVLANAQLYSQTSKAFTTPMFQGAAQALNEARFLHTATVLGTGDVMLAGGVDSNGASLASVELYHAGTQTFTEATRLNVARDSATATGLGGGRVLIAGGRQIQSGGGASLLDSAEIYDAGANPPTAVCVGGMSGAGCNSSMKSQRRLHTATFIPSSNAVLITGGIDGTGNPTTSAETFSPGPNGGSFSGAGSMAEARAGHSATYLDPNSGVTGKLAGMVLIVGGNNSLIAEVYNPSSGFSPLPSPMNEVHSFHTATLLNNGRVLIAGGGAALSNGFFAEPIAEIFDPPTQTFAPAGDLISGRAFQTATLLASGPLMGRVLIAGGASTNSVQAGVELFTPQ